MQPQWGMAAAVRPYCYTHTQPQWRDCATATTAAATTATAPSPSPPRTAALHEAVVVYPAALGRACVCATCHASMSQCSCARCHVCECAIGRTTRHHCRQCDKPVCDACWVALRHTRIGRAAVRVCDVCALRWALAHLAVYATGTHSSTEHHDDDGRRHTDTTADAGDGADAAVTATTTTTTTESASSSSSTGLLWGVYVLHSVCELPNRCAVPSCATMTYLPVCYMCKAPTVLMQPHLRRSVRLARASASVVECLRTLDAQERWRRARAVAQYTRADVDAVFARCYAAGATRASVTVDHNNKDDRSGDEARQFRAHGGSVAETRTLLLAAVAAALAYEYALAPSLSLALADVPYARLLAVVDASSRYTVFDAADNVRYIAFPGTHDWRTVCVNTRLQTHHVDVRVPLVEGVVVGDDGVARVLHGGVRRVWQYTSHAGFAAEARNAGVDVAALLRDLRTAVDDDDDDGSSSGSGSRGGRDACRRRRRHRRVVLCGHSLGGAIAQLVALDVLHAGRAWLFDRPTHNKNNDNNDDNNNNNDDDDADAAVPRVMCVTFGAPLHASDDLARMVRERGWQHCFHNVVYRHDVVPRLACVDDAARATLRGVLERASGVYQSVQSWLTTWLSSPTTTATTTMARATASVASPTTRACRRDGDDDDNDDEQEMTLSDATPLGSEYNNSAAVAAAERDGSDEAALLTLVDASLRRGAAWLDDGDRDAVRDDGSSSSSSSSPQRQQWSHRDGAAAATTTYTPRASRRGYACLGRYYFLCYGDAGYVSTDDAAYASALLTAGPGVAAVLADHRMVSYYRALMQHVNGTCC